MISTGRAAPDAGYHPCPQGRHYGPDGAAGALVWATRHGRAYVLLGKRSANVQQGGTWSTIGGAIDHGETPLDAAMRELGEEICGLDSSRGTVTFELIAPCLAGCGWSYSTYVVRVPLAARAGRHGRLPRVRVATDAYNQWETDKAAWFGVHRVAGLRLHPGLAAAWPALRPAVRRDRA